MDDGGGDVGVVRELEDEAEGDAVVGAAEEGEVDVVAAVGDWGGGGFFVAVEGQAADCAVEFGFFHVDGGAAEAFVDEDCDVAGGGVEGSLDEGFLHVPGDGIWSRGVKIQNTALLVPRDGDEDEVGEVIGRLAH